MLNQGISANSSSRAKDAHLARLRGSSLGSYFTPTQLENIGIGYEGLRTLLNAGLVIREGRGLYRFAEAEITEHTSLAAVCARVPRSVVCLITALHVHDIGTQISPAVWLAIPKNAKPPKVESVELRLVKFSETAWSYGVVETSFEGVPARITNPPARFSTASASNASSAARRRWKPCGTVWGARTSRWMPSTVPSSFCPHEAFTQLLSTCRKRMKAER